MLLAMTSCERVLMGIDMRADAVTTFEHLWRQFDEQYSEFDVKGVDWRGIHDLYKDSVEVGMAQEELFAVCCRMLDVLNDGHVNLISGFDTYHNTEVFRRMAAESNLDYDCVLLNYLKPDYHTASGFLHNDLGNGVIYIRYASFSNAADSSRLRYLFNQYAETESGLNGVILDLRQNGGGSIQHIWNILGLFQSHGQLLYTTQAKNGPGHEDFCPATEVRADNNPNGFNMKVAVLTDRGSYSASSFFTLCAKEYDNMRVIGDTTGGGMGLPRNGQLPNGWYYRLSSTRTLAADGKNYENGVPPDEVVKLDRNQTAVGRDNVIEHAKSWILE